MLSKMQAAIRHNLRNHSRRFITGADVHTTFKAQTRKEMLAASQLHKKTIAKARRARKPAMSEFIDTEAHVLPQMKKVYQLERDVELQEEKKVMIDAGDICERKKQEYCPEPLLEWREK
tara:strand:- start:414 stop:770 length:357 start_codon:yes stop_codon:yes gene_type:complete